MNTNKKQFPANYSEGLIHTIDRDDKQVNCKISISLDDKCRNGHHDFAITGTFWYIGSKRRDESVFCGGCCHEEILKHFPELQIFVDLHLSDFKGVPMYAVENGYYHLTQTTKEKFLSYYPDITAQDYKTLIQSINTSDYCLKLQSLGIFDRWESKAKLAISTLEEMTGKKIEGVLSAAAPISTEKMEF